MYLSSEEKPIVVQSEAWMVAMVAHNLRPIDSREVFDACGSDPAAAVLDSFDKSCMAWTGIVGGAPVATFGVVPCGDRDGIPWLVGTRQLENVQFTFAKLSRPYLSAMLERFDMLHNHVAAYNELSIRWLRWLGFTIDAPVPVGPGGAMFHHFWIGG